MMSLRALVCQFTALKLGRIAKGGVHRLGYCPRGVD